MLGVEADLMFAVLLQVRKYWLLRYFPMILQDTVLRHYSKMGFYTGLHEVRQ
jgi:hypothetical protein